MESSQGFTRSSSQGIDRRGLLREVSVLGSLGLVCPRAPWKTRWRPAGSRIEDLAARLRTMPREDVAAQASRAIREGATAKELLGAAFLTAVREIRPHPVGGPLHSAFVVESVLALIEDAPAEEAWVAALWTLDDVKDGLQVDASREDWRLPDSRPLEGSPAALELELRTACVSFDGERADRAVTGLARAGRGAQAFEVLWPFVVRSFRDAGHRVVHAAQTERVLRRLGPGLEEDPLRSLVLGLADDAVGPLTAAYDSGRELAPRLARIPERSDPTGQAADFARSLEVLAALRGHDVRASQEVVVAAVEDGLARATVWDGLRLLAAELMWLRPARRRLFPVHCVTELESLGYVFARARAEATRDLVLVQAAAWLAQVRDAVASGSGAYASGTLEPLLASPGEDAPDLDRALASRSGRELAMALAQRRGREPAVLASVRAELVPRADQNHQYKLLAAVREEARRTHPRWRPAVVAAGLDYLPTSAEPTGEVQERARRALHEAGVL